MSEPFLAEIRIVGFNFAPRGWAFCDGQILPIDQNQSLYSLLGTYYGGDGRASFGLPDLRGRTAINKSDGHSLAQNGGTETVTLSSAEMPAHTHVTKANSSEGDNASPAGDNLSATPAGELLYNDPGAASMTALRAGTVTNAGGGQAHDNMQPYLALNFCIALQGLYPSRN